MDGLTEEQHETLRQFQEITNMEDVEIAVCTLASLDWDLTRAIEAQLGGNEEVAPAVGDVDEIQILDELPAREPRPPRYAARHAADNISNQLMQDLRNSVRFHEEVAGVLRPDDMEIVSDDDEIAAIRVGARAAREQMNNRPTTSSNRVSSGLHSNGVGNRRHGAGRQGDSDQSDDDVYMVNDSYEHEEEPCANGNVPLIPADSDTVDDSLHNFVAVFDARFSSAPSFMMPPFYTGPLNMAAREAFEAPDRPLDDRRPLAIYIHHDRAIAANIFPVNVLGSEAVTSLLRGQYVLWPWDFTLRQNEERLMHWLDMFGMTNVRRFIDVHSRSKDQFPMLLTLVKEKGTVSVVNCSFGMDSVDVVVGRLMEGLETFSHIHQNTQKEAEARRQREQLLEEQHQQYNESLEKDRALMDEKERKEKEEKEEVERVKREEEEEITQRQLLASQLPSEPAEGEPGAIAIKFRLPEGEQFVRRFRNSEVLAVLVNYLASHGYSKDKFRYFNSDFPKKDVSTFDETKTLSDLKFPSREQIFVEER